MRTRFGLAVSVPAMVLAVLLVARAPMAAAPKTTPTITRGDLRWLERVTFGINEAIVARYELLGREKFLDDQLHPAAADPKELADQIAAMPALRLTAEARVRAARAEQQRINALPRDAD